MVRPPGRLLSELSGPGGCRVAARGALARGSGPGPDPGRHQGLVLPLAAPAARGTAAGGRAACHSAGSVLAA